MRHGCKEGALKEVCFALGMAANPLRDLEVRYHSRVSVVGCQGLGTREMVLALKVKGGDWRGFITDLESLKDVSQVFVGGRKGEDTQAILVRIQAPVFCAAIRASTAICSSCPFDSPDNDRGDWRILVGDATALRKVMNTLRRRQAAGVIRQVSNPGPFALLTPRQWEVIVLAIEAGYFESPRKISLTALASRLSISPPSLSEVLRHAEGRVLAEYVGSGSPRVARSRYLRKWQ